MEEEVVAYRVKLKNGELLISQFTTCNLEYLINAINYWVNQYPTNYEISIVAKKEE